MSKESKNDADLSFELDIRNSCEVGDIERDVFPKSRRRFIELLEDQDDSQGLNSKINCQSLKWEVECPMAWDKLTPTEFDDVRHCSLCEEKVYTAYSQTELKLLTKQGACVRVITERLDDALGMLQMPYDCGSLSDGSDLLIGEILLLASQVKAFKRRRGFDSAVKLKRLLGRLNRYEQQELIGLRVGNSVQSSEKIAKLKELIDSRSKIEAKYEQALHYLKSE